MLEQHFELVGLLGFLAIWLGWFIDTRQNLAHIAWEYISLKLSGIGIVLIGLSLYYSTEAPIC